MASTIETAIRSVVGKGIEKVADYNRSRMRDDGPNIFLTGIHKPMTGEETIADLSVDGSIPASLDGRYLRIGPNPVTPPNPAAYHWFTGDGMAHGVRVQGGKALWYRNRWIRSNAVSDALGEPRAPGQRSQLSDNANTNIVGIAGRTWAIVEAGGNPVELSDGLDTVAHNPFDGTLDVPFSAHPHHCPLTGEMHAITYDAMTHDRVWHVVVDGAARVIRQEPIAVSDGPSIHDCALTASRVVILDLPVTFSMKSVIAGHRFPYVWNTAHRARVGLLGRDDSGEDVIWCDVDPCYVFHPANAFDLPDGRVVMDVVAHETMFAESRKGPDSPASRLERWTIDPVARRVDRKVLLDHPQEFPRYDERRTGKPYRWLYSMALPEGVAGELSIADTRLFRTDLESGAVAIHDFGPGRHPGEFVFVERPGGEVEDDGWLIGLVIDMNRETTELQILNADDFEGEPQAVIHIPHRVPPGFHGNWVPA